ncbi:MAG: indole-3-glycerol phosphate synthase TrpC [Candidatus Omnitrophica bacterium]|nr:indole-3-glycerol phosphate synthase TrpC [Candidatus Omnitrophota bacterium]
MLQKIIEHKKSLIERDKSSLPLDVLKKATRHFPVSSIIQKTKENDFIVIAEAKKASPSGGIFRKKYNPARIAISYEKAGATAISVLTEERYFLGCIEHLKQVKKAVKIPVVAKDFFIDEYQIYQAYVSGADCILLILKILIDDEFLHLAKVARKLNLEILVEIQNKEELSRFFKISGVNSGMLLGINSRNLDTLEINTAATISLLSMIKDIKIPVIAESGITNSRTLVELRKAGASGVLIGTYLLRAHSPGKALKQLLKEMRNG